MLKHINGFDDYYVDDTGVVYSNKSGYLKPISQWKDGKGRYLLVHIVNNDGKAKNVLVHRIVCEAFLPNPKDLPEVNHKDNNPQNNNLYNLEWCTRKENLQQSYKTMSPVRNYRECILYKNNQYISTFQSINAACRFAAKQYNASYSMLNKHRKWRDIQIVMK